ncbi:o-succinylbenzoate synthase [Jeotgalibacillus soli]|uniref:o-succinylbenzoate synthase n=1 Tax=Jeotgalibacillus soli TaxID=889306 RepID=A0A0C2V4I9_9BACL|nr:o-succinylbenzoate synthase [Jeotgalibacillus soli]KIL43947.1 O-succinylbenzoate synthase [Jeotgalibacillus soli]
MKFTKVELHVIQMALKAPFVTSLGIVKERKGIIVELHDDQGHIGYGESVAFETPWYTEETVKTCFHMIKDILAPIVLKQSYEHPTEVFDSFNTIRKNPMAKAAVDMAAWDVFAKIHQLPLHQMIGGTRSDILAGVVVGASTIDEVLKQIQAFKAEGYERVKIKIGPGKDYDWMKEIRHSFPELSILADANSAYSGVEDQLLEIDELGLQMIEQPLGQDDLVDHARLQKKMVTPICLDESITSLHAAKSAIALQSGRVINIKIGRVGGLTEAIRIHDLCQKHGIQVWCGGMLEFGVSRAHNVALATLSGFSIPGDISSSSRYWQEDITTPDVVVERGRILPFEGVGIGVEINRKRLDEVRIHHEVLIK